MLASSPPSPRLPLIPAALGVSLLLLACKPAMTSVADTAKPEPAADTVAARPTTVILVRHGEKAGDDPRDPSLSAAGEARARALARLLARAGVTHLFASEYRRTQATLRPLAGAIGLEPAIVPAADGAALLAAIAALPAGSVAVIAGHSNTLPALVTGLGGEVHGAIASASGPQLPDDAYDRLFMVILPARGQVQTLELRYGEGR
jgi:phosphohistidine phosphatase SixA